MGKVIVAVALAVGLLLATALPAMARPTATRDVPCNAGETVSVALDISGAPPLTPPNGDPTGGTIAVNCVVPSP